jgi:hypothetical protein
MVDRFADINIQKVFLASQIEDNTLKLNWVYTITLQRLANMTDY